MFEQNQTRKFFIIFLAVLIIVSTYADADTQLFTKDNVLAAGCYNDGFASSDMTLIIQLEAGGKIIFDEGAKVKYATITKPAVPLWVHRRMKHSSPDRARDGLPVHLAIGARGRPHELLEPPVEVGLVVEPRGECDLT